MDKINEILTQIKKFPISIINNGFYVNHKGKKIIDLSFTMPVDKLVFPLREGEIIKNIDQLPTTKNYSLSYPGTASTKSMILFSPDSGGIFIGGNPTYEWAKIKIKRIKDNIVKITYRSPEHGLYFINFRINWRLAAEQYKQILNISQYTATQRKVKYFLQIGIKDSFGTSHIKNFSDLRPVIDYFYREMGPGHIIHLFGTNQDGFDRMSPDYTIAEEIGGKKGLKNFLNYIKEKGFLTSHHYNPRIADSNWLKKNPEFADGIITKRNGKKVLEEYKNHPHYFMNPNCKIWFERSMETVEYLKNIGFDYIQIDQFTYQRNFYNPEKPIQMGYKKMIKEFERLKIKHWLEGVSDIHKLKPGNFYQILTRDIPQVWEDNESRRGYPYGVSYPAFFMYLYPNYEVSYQLVTEKNHFKYFERRLKIARRINAAIYDLQMTFYNPSYMNLLKNLIKKVKQYDAVQG